MADYPRETLDRIEREAHDWLVRFASGSATPADLHEGKQWCERDPAHAEAFRKATGMWDALGPEAFEDSKHRLPRSASTPLSRRAVLGAGVGAIAACGTYVVVRPPLGLWPSFAELAADYRTQTGERRRIVVAETAVVEMNTQTSIALRMPAKDAAGIELIAGEAMVATQKAAGAFEVAAGGGTSSGTGSRFNVRNDGRSVCVTCVEGTVHVSFDASMASLRAREQVVYDRSGLGSVVATDPALVIAWQEDQLIFHARPLRDVVAEINRYRASKIIIVNNALGARLFSANFRVSNAGAVVDQVQKLFGATVTALPGGIVLLS